MSPRSAAPHRAPATLLAALPLLALAAACGSPAVVNSEVAPPPADPEVRAAPMAVDAPAWSATLQPQALTTIRGTVIVTPASPTAGMRADTATAVMIRVVDAPAGAVYPWHIHQGTCGSGGGIWGPASAYPTLRVGDDGRATATATLDRAVPDGGDYYVNVHASPDSLGTIVACGALRPGPA